LKSIFNIKHTAFNIQYSYTNHCKYIIKQLDNYSPPWTYEVSSDEAFARLKGLLSSTTSSNKSYNILEIDEDDKYIKVEVYSA
jgi:hypothetical protein